MHSEISTGMTEPRLEKTEPETESNDIAEAAKPPSEIMQALASLETKVIHMPHSATAYLELSSQLPKSQYQ